MPIARPKVLLAPMAAILVALGLSACTDEPCDAYVDYMCDCEVDQEGCDELRTAYEDAGADLQDECSIALDDERSEDEESGDECEADTGV